MSSTRSGARSHPPQNPAWARRRRETRADREQQKSAAASKPTISHVRASPHAYSGVTNGQRRRTMPEHKTGTREEWQAARDDLAKLEAEHAELGQRVTERRRQLPWVAVEKEYRFD